MPKPVHRKPKPEPKHARKGDPMPCPLCSVGTCIPCYNGNHDDCVNLSGEAIVGCVCCEVEVFA